MAAKTAEASRHQDLFKVLAWTFAETNRFFHILYHGGIWLDPSVARRAVSHGWAMCVARQHILYAMVSQRCLLILLMPPIRSLMDIDIAEEGFMALASICATLKYRLFRLRPKLHLLAHVVTLDEINCTI